MNTNTASINAQFNLNKVNQEMEKAMEQLSSGKRINSAADDAAGLSIATRMESQVRGLNQAMRNAADGQSLAATAEGAMNEITNMLQRMRELAVQSASDTNNDDDRANLNAEVDQLQAEIDRVVNTTTFNNKKLLDGTAEMALQIGTNAAETLSFDIANLSTSSLGGISGAVAGNAVTAATFENSTIPVETKTQLTFNGNDEYSFTLTIGAETVDIADAVVSGSNAEDVVDKINAALRDDDTGITADVNLVDVSYSGNVVTITNKLGTDIGVEATDGVDLSKANSTITYSSIAGMAEDDLAAGDALNNVILASTNTFVGDAFGVAAGDEFTEATKASDATAATAEVVLTAASVAADDIATLTLSVEGEEDVVIPSGALTAGASATAVGDALAEADSGDLYTVTNDAGTLTVTRADGINFTAAITAVDSSDPAADTDTVSATDVISEDGVEAVEEAEAAGGSKLYLEMVGADTYTFSLTDADALDVDFEIEYRGTETSLQAAATLIGTELGDGWTVTVDKGALSIMRESGSAFDIESFGSEAGGRIMASTDAATATDDDGRGKLLEENTYATTALTSGIGAYDDTVVAGTISSDDDHYTFSISDGTATAQVKSALGEDIVAAINYALSIASMGGTAGSGLLAEAVAGADDGAIDFTITHQNGGTVSITNFRSDSTGTMQLATSGDDTTGFTRVLDDGDGAAGDTVSAISMASAASASAAIEVLDKALEDINTERSKLGAISNRLDHTISNLGNVVINTEASQSRIEDADFAKVTGDLTKSQIMSQAATAMLAQANASKQGVLSLLQG
ncbi:flagellin [Planktomarina temperata]|nr:flagellin [Planktomarina temperata]